VGSGGGGLTGYHNLGVSVVVSVVKCYGSRENLEMLETWPFDGP